MKFMLTKKDIIALNEVFDEGSVINEASLDFAGKLVVGKFVDKERPTFLDAYGAVNRGEIGEWPNVEQQASMPVPKASGGE